MSRIRQCLTAADGLKLANSLVIKGSTIEDDIIAFKMKRGLYNPQAPLLGATYWQGFMKRNGDKLQCKRGQKYATDRANWSTYHKFLQMYTNVYSEMVNAGVAIKLDTPVWMDAKGNEVPKEYGFGQLCTHQIIHPEMCVVADEVGSNTSQKGDGHIGGRKYLCENGMVPYQKMSNKDKHFTVMGFTLLTGKPIMCAVIISVNVMRGDIETGIDIFAKQIGLSTDIDYIEKNSGKGKLFPGGPTCEFNSIIVPCFIRWTESGSISSEILKEAFQTMDHLGLFPRSVGLTPFALLDAHGSRLETPFLSYINTPPHEWVVTIGTPYGTAYWQVGDSKEQNGSFKIAMTKEKCDIMIKKGQKMMEQCIEPHEIMPILNFAWERSFVREDKNQNAISDRGWNPLNYNLLNNPDIRATMTFKEKQDELKNITSSISPPMPVISTEPMESISDLSSSERLVASQDNMNFSQGTAGSVICSLIGHNQLMVAREKIREEKDMGKSYFERIKESKTLTGGVIARNGCNRLGKVHLILLWRETEREK